MFERLQKPFLTVETGEAYQPIRLAYSLNNPTELHNLLSKHQCFEQANNSLWNWYWSGECENLQFESVDSYQKNAARPVRLGSIKIQQDRLYISLPSFKRACLAVPFFHQIISNVAMISTADFVNKVFGLNERLPHGFTELFNDEELERIVHEREAEYYKVQSLVEHAPSADAAFKILADYTKSESGKRLPYAERYAFHENEQHAEPTTDPEILFLGFYIFLRGRELVAIRRWFGETGYSLADAAEETLEQVFGGMNIDLLDD